MSRQSESRGSKASATTADRTTKPESVIAFRGGLADGVSQFVTDGSETVGIGRDGSGISAAEKSYGITLFGNGRDRLESPSLGSTPGHPIKTSVISEAFSPL